MWYAKMYFSGEKEFFENDAFGMQGLIEYQVICLMAVMQTVRHAYRTMM